MPNTTDFDAVTGSTAYDSVGDKVGKVEQIYISNTTDLPVWVAVKTGLFGSSKSLVPLAGARHDGDRLDVKVTKDAIKDAPHLDADGGTSQEQNTELLRHYGLTDETAGWDSYGKHNAAAGQAPASGVAAGAAAGAGANAGRTADNTGNPSVVRSEEQLNVGTERVQSGTARLRKYVVTEQETITVPVEREEVEIVREPVTNAGPGETKIGEDSAEVTLHEDKVTAHKDTVPVERVGLDVNTVNDTETVSDTVRKEQIDTEGVADAKRNANPKR